MPRKNKSSRKNTRKVNSSEKEEIKSPPEYMARQSGPSNLLVILLILVSFFAGYLFFKLKGIEQGNQANTAPQPSAQTVVTKDQLKKLFTKDYIHFGNPNSKLLLVEISDPSCPYCHVAGGQNPELSGEPSFSGGRFKYISQGGTYVPPVPEMKKLVDSGKAAMAILYSPGHGSGELGMQAFYCAFEKGKFWEVHDLIMTKAGYDLLNNTVQNNKANIPTLVDFLSGAVDSNSLSDCLNSGKYAKNLPRDTQTGRSLGFSGTPHFFVNTTPFKGAYSYTDMESAVKAAL